MKFKIIKIIIFKIIYLFHKIINERNSNLNILCGGQDKWKASTYF